MTPKARRARPILLVLLLPMLLPGSLGCRDVGKEEHVLNRIGYGPDPWSRNRIRELGVQGYIEEQLQPQTLDDAALEADIAARYPLTTWSLQQVRHTYHEYSALSVSRVRQEMSWARLLRNVRSKRQLEQVLVDFWHNHFNVDATTESGRWGVVTYEREAIRPFVLGRFRDMLGAVAAHPSMLDYLDNTQNFVPGYRRGTTTFGPNENYARELLELHTVGVDAGYTLQDIQEVARVFTGWTVNYYFPNGTYNYFQDSFVYEDAGHDKGAKSIMGQLHVPAGGGQEEGSLVLDFLAQHPATARFVAFKLAQRFVADDPPQALVDAAAQVFRQTGGDLRAVTRTILLSPEFLAPQYRGAKAKSPQHYVSSLARAVGVVDDATFADRAARELARMGEDLYAAAPPTGYPGRSTAWLGEGPFVFRVNVAVWATYGLYGFGPAVSSTVVADPTALISDLSSRMTHGGLRSTTFSRLTDFAAQIPQSNRAQQAAAMLLTSPEFLVH